MNDSVGLIICCSAILIYCYSLDREFVFDDIKAVVENDDLNATVPYSNLLWNNYLGTLFSKEQNSNFYRPLTTLSFKLNNLVFGDEPFYFHIVNNLLYFLCCFLFHNLVTKLSDVICSFSKSKSGESFSLADIATALFIVHPVHVEAVVMVSGRAELLSAVFYLLSILFCIKLNFSCKILSVVFLVCSTASMEQGVAAAALCLFLELVILRKEKLLEFVRTRSTLDLIENTIVPTFTHGFWIILSVAVFAVLQLAITHGSLFHSHEFYSPALRASWTTRFLTYNYLLPINVLLLVSPTNLLCDWSMGAVPLVTSFADPRNLLTVGFWITALLFVYHARKNINNVDGRLTCVGIVMTSVPYFHKSDFYFLQVSERALFIPSFGFTLLVAIAIKRLYRNLIGRRQVMLHFCIAFVLISHSLQTIRRTMDWKNNYTLFNSALKVNRENAKMWNGIGDWYEKEGRLSLALEYYSAAAQTQPEDFKSHLNLAVVWEKLRDYAQAERSYRQAKSLLPKPIEGASYTNLISENHLQVFIGMAKLIQKNKTRWNEVSELYDEAVAARPTSFIAHFGKGEILSLLGRHEDAIKVFYKALDVAATTDHQIADLYFNIGFSESKMKRQTQAYEAYTLSISYNLSHIESLINSATILIETENADHLRSAEKRLKRVLMLDEAHLPAMCKLGTVYLATERADEALLTWKRVVEIDPNHATALHGIAYFYFKTDAPDEIYQRSLRNLLEKHPTHEGGLLLEGDYQFNRKKDFRQAKNIYERVMANSGDENGNKYTTANHNLCVCLYQLEHLYEAEDCFSQLTTRLPQPSVKTNLKLVRDEIERRVKVGKLRERGVSLKEEKEDDRREEVVPRQRRAQQSDDDEILLSDNTSGDDGNHDDGDDALDEVIRLVDRADRIHQNLLDLASNRDPRVTIDVKLQQATEAVARLTDIKRQLAAGATVASCSSSSPPSSSGKEEAVEGESKADELLRMLDDLESKL